MNKTLLLTFSIIFVSCNAIKLDYDYITSSNQEIKSSLSKSDKKNWHNLDIEKDSVPGTSVERAYNELLNEIKKWQELFDKNSDLIIGHGFSKYYEKHFSNF